MNQERKSSIPVVSLLRRSRSIKPYWKLWPVWVAAFTLLSSLGTGSAGAAPHAKNTTKNKTNHAKPVAQETRLFATGTVDPATSTIKAVTTDNRFTWLHLLADASVIQGGKNSTADAIGEGNKLSCQGKWVDDAWGPVFQANRVEIMGNIGDASLRQKVAAACQAIQGASPSNSNDDTTTSVSAGDDGTAALDLDNLATYTPVYVARAGAAAKAFQEVYRLFSAARTDPTMRHKLMAVKAMQAAVAKYKQALDAEDAITPG